MDSKRIERAKSGVLCPVSHKACKLCGLYRGRHYYCLPACEEYQRRLHEAAVPRSLNK